MINWLELRVAHLALQTFQAQMEGYHVPLLTDSIMKAHINWQGGTLSRSLMKEAEALCRWAGTHLLSLRADHIAGMANVRADWLSQATVDPLEWRLHPRLFAELADQFGHLVVDL